MKHSSSSMRPFTISVFLAGLAQHGVNWRTRLAFGFPHSPVLVLMKDSRERKPVMPAMCALRAVTIGICTNEEEIINVYSMSYNSTALTSLPLSGKF